MSVAIFKISEPINPAAIDETRGAGVWGRPVVVDVVMAMFSRVVISFEFCIEIGVVATEVLAGKVRIPEDMGSRIIPR